jgi:hypothetical protein
MSFLAELKHFEFKPIEEQFLKERFTISNGRGLIDPMKRGIP